MNGDKQDNRIENLLPGSQSDNVKDWHRMRASQQSCVNIAIEADNPTNIITRLSKYVSDETLLKVAAHIRMRSLPKVRFHGVRNDTRFI